MRIEDLLIENEKVLYEFNPDNNHKVKANYIGEVLALILSLFISIIIISTGKFNLIGSMFFLLSAILISYFAVMSISSKRKDSKQLLDGKYYITDKRVIVLLSNDYEEINIMAIVDSKIEKINDEYGNIILSNFPIMKDNKDFKNNASQMMSAGTITSLKLQSIKNPEEVLNIIMNIKNT